MNFSDEEGGNLHETVSGSPQSTGGSPEKQWWTEFCRKNGELKVDCSGGLEHFTHLYSISCFTSLLGTVVRLGGIMCAVDVGGRPARIDGGLPNYALLLHEHAGTAYDQGLHWKGVAASFSCFKKAGGWGRVMTAVVLRTVGRILCSILPFHHRLHCRSRKWNGCRFCCTNVAHFLALLPLK